MKARKLNKMQEKTSLNRIILFFACLFAVINLYGQGEALSNSSELAQATTTSSAEGPFYVQRENVTQNGSQIVAEAVLVEQVTPAADTDSVEATPFCRHELSLWGAGGFSSLFYDANFGDRKFQLGGAFGLGYTFYFSQHFGILVGAEVAFYNTLMKIDGLTHGYDTQDPLGEDINYRSRIDNYEEKQRMTNVNIPLALQFQTGGKHKFFASLGFKLGIPIYGKYEMTKGTFSNTGYYYKWNQEFGAPQAQPDLGYGVFNERKVKEDVDFELSYMGTVEAGVKWRLNRSLSLYTGAYFEYGFNDVVDKHDVRFVDYNHSNPENFDINSTLVSEYTQNGRTESFTEKVSPMAFGIKLRLGVNLCKKSKAEKEEELVAADTLLQLEEKKPESKKEKAKAIIAARDEEERKLADEEMEEDLRRAISEYGAVRSVVTIELEGYEIDQATLSPRMERILNENVDRIRRLYGTDILIICEGHTCDLGSEEYNLRLGQKRAEVVRNFIIGKGYNPDNVYAVSKGESTPIVPNNSEANRKKNRRVVLIVRDLN